MCVSALGNDERPCWQRRTLKGLCEELTSGANTAYHGYVKGSSIFIHGQTVYLFTNVRSLLGILFFIYIVDHYTKQMQSM